MQRTTIFLDPAIKRLLRDEARRRGVTEASILREALARYFADQSPPEPRPVGKSKDGGVARRLDDALAESGFGRPRR